MGHLFVPTKTLFKIPLACAILILMRKLLGIHLRSQKQADIPRDNIVLRRLRMNVIIQHLPGCPAEVDKHTFCHWDLGLVSHRFRMLQLKEMRRLFDFGVTRSCWFCIESSHVLPQLVSPSDAHLNWAGGSVNGMNPGQGSRGTIAREGNEVPSSCGSSCCGKLKLLWAVGLSWQVGEERTMVSNTGTHRLELCQSFPRKGDPSRNRQMTFHVELELVTDISIPFVGNSSSPVDGLSTCHFYSHKHHTSCLLLSEWINCFHQAGLSLLRDQEA